MPSECAQQRIARLLDQAKHAAGRNDWTKVRWTSDSVLAADPENEVAIALLDMAMQQLGQFITSHETVPEANLAKREILKS